MALRIDTSDKLERTGPDDDKRYHHRYQGYVRDNLDPERRGRVRVYCPEVMGEVDEPNRWLGWAEANAAGSGFDQGLFMVPTMPQDTPRDQGDSTSPYNQTRVWVTFRDGDPSKPIYDMGGPWISGDTLAFTPILTDADNGGDESLAKPNGVASSVKFEADYETGELSTGFLVREPVPSTQATYPRNNVFKSSGGSIVEFDDTPGAERIKIFHPAGSYYEINQSGSVVERVTGKRIEFVSDERFSSIRGPSTEVYQATEHKQVDRSSQQIYRDSRMVVTEKGEKRFNRASLDHVVGGLLNVTVDSYVLQAAGKAEIIGATEANLGGQSVNIQGVDTLVYGANKTEVVGFAQGVSLIGALRVPANPIYASLEINTALTVATGVYAPIAATFASELASLIATSPATPVPAGVMAPWVAGVTAYLASVTTAFNAGLTVHTASKL